jgi:hypothetical protein
MNAKGNRIPKQFLLASIRVHSRLKISFYWIYAQTPLCLLVGVPLSIYLPFNIERITEIEYILEKGSIPLPVDKLRPV